MAIHKRKNIHKSENVYGNKLHNGYNRKIPSAKLAKKIIRFISLILFYNSIILTEEENLNITQLGKISEITMNISGIGDKKILGYNFKDFPSEVYINGVLQRHNNKKQYYFNSSENFVQLFFNYKITFCAYMFYGVEAKEIDLSKFDSLDITNMEYMFFSCTNLISLNLTNFKTHKVKHMDYLFYKC